MLHIAERSYSVLGREHSAGLYSRIVVETHGEVVLKISLRDTLGTRRLEHSVDIRQTIWVKLMESFS
jgi:hypothetical protein